MPAKLVRVRLNRPLFGYRTGDVVEIEDTDFLRAYLADGALTAAPTAPVGSPSQDVITRDELDVALAAERDAVRAAFAHLNEDGELVIVVNGTETIVGGSGGGGLTTEQVQDLVDAMVVAGANITKSYDDAAGKLTITATGGGGSGSGLPSTVAARTSAYTAAAGDFVLADAATAGFTVTLPTAPAVGALVTVKKVDGTANVVTVAPATGGSIDGDANATIVSPDFGAIFQHVGSNDWHIVAVTAAGGSNGVDGQDGADGDDGAPGVGVPAGGTTGQILAKNTATDFDTEWIDPPSGDTGGGGGSPSFLLATHLGLGHRSGRWYDGGINAAQRLPTTPGTNFGYVQPFYVPNAETLDRLGVLVNTPQAGGRARLGIYDSDADGLPGTLLVDAGEIDVSTAGGKQVTISQAVPADTWLWLAYTMNTGGVALAGLPAAAQPSLGFAALTDVSPPARGYRTHTYGALPTTFGAATFDAAATAVVRARVA